MSDKNKRSAFTTVVMSDIENNTQEVVYNSYTLPLLIYDGTDMSKNIEKIEAVPNKGITIQDDIVFYDNTYEEANSTFEFVLITLNELEGSTTHTLAELIEHGFTITPFINGGGGESSDFSTAEVTINWNTSLLEELSKDNCPMLQKDALYEEAPYLTGNLYATTSPVVVEVPLYKGKCYWDLPSLGVTTTGNIAELNDGYLITGDCTITIS